MYKDGDILLPGEPIEWEGKIIGEVYRENNKAYPKFISTVRVSESTLKVIPLTKVYIPKRGEYVVGVIKEIIPVGWEVDINSPYRAILPIREASNLAINPLEVDLSKLYRVGEIIFAKVVGISKFGTVTLTMKGQKAKKLKGGILIKVNPAKVPRIIGKGGSLVKLFKDYANVRVYVGQNGYIYLKGDLERVEYIVELIRYLEKYSHKHGLTDYIKEKLEEKFGPVKNKEATESSQSNSEENQ